MNGQSSLQGNAIFIFTNYIHTTPDNQKRFSKMENGLILFDPQNSKKLRTKPWQTIFCLMCTHCVSCENPNDTEIQYQKERM